MSILDDKKFRNGDISTNFIKDKFKKGYQSNLALNYDKEIKLSIFALVLHCYQIKEESLKKNKSYAVKINDNYTDIQILKFDFSKKVLISTFEISNEKYDISASIKLIDKIHHIEINNVIYSFKLNNLINMHRFDISYFDARINSHVISQSHKKLLRIMPKIMKEDLSKKLISPMPGLIKSINVVEGQKIKNGDQILIIEAMKMENILKCEKDCKIEKILINSGDSVGADEELVLFSN